MCSVNFEALVSLTLTSIEKLSEFDDETTELIFSTTCGRTFRMFHKQDCCERVYLEDVCGDLNNLLGAPVQQAECVKQEYVNPSENTPGYDLMGWHDASLTWTFYKIATIKGSVTLRWYGASNGYYSEGVDFKEISHA